VKQEASRCTKEKCKKKKETSLKTLLNEKKNENSKQREGIAKYLNSAILDNK